MIFDNQALFSKAQAITVTAASTNAIDLGLNGTVYGQVGAMPKDVGKGNPIPFLVQVVETFDTAAEDGTLTIALELDSTETFTPDKSIALGVYTEAQLVAGFQIPWSIIPDGVNLRYAQLKYTVGGAGAFTAGKITAGIVAARQTDGVA